MLRTLLIIAIFGFINNNNIINKNNSNINNLDSDIKRCNEFAFNKTNNYDLFNNINNNSNYLNEILNNTNNDNKEIIKYKKIRLNCIKRKKEKIISDIVISYMALFGLLLIIYI
jgi:hypothetical protein